MTYPKRLIEVDLPIKRISAHARREKSIRHGHISTLHIWWARRPLAACRAVICAALWPDPADENCPIRRQVIPSIEEIRTAPWEMSDPCGEDSHSPVPGLVHRYPDRVLFLVTDRCAAYCRYCTRSRLVSPSTTGASLAPGV